MPAAQKVSESTPEIDATRTSGRGHHLDPRFHLYARTSAGGAVQFADGGPVNWTPRLPGNAEARLVIRGTSSERVCTGLA